MVEVCIVYIFQAKPHFIGIAVSMFVLHVQSLRVDSYICHVWAGSACSPQALGVSSRFFSFLPQSKVICCRIVTCDEFAIPSRLSPSSQEKIPGPLQSFVR